MNLRQTLIEVEKETYPAHFMKSVLPQSQKYHKESKQTNIPHEHGYKILTNVLADQILKYIKNFKQHEKAGYYKNARLV